MLSEKQQGNAECKEKSKRRTSHHTPPMTTPHCQSMVGREPAYNEGLSMAFLPRPSGIVK